MVNTTDIPQLLITVQEASQAISISAKTVRNFIRTGRLSSVNLGIRMTRIRLQDLILMAEEYGIQVEIPSYTPVSNDNKKRIVPNFSYSQAETGAANKTAKCRRTPKAGEKAPDGVTHATHYTMAEVLSRFNIKYGRFYEVRNRFQLQSVHAWGTTCFKKDEVENAIKSYNDEQGKSLSDDWYTCFEIMKLYGLGKTQVRRFAETYGVRIKQVKGGRANYYLKADWEAARKKAAKNSASVKAKRG
jgi:excisionase family DNA binding protein